MTFLSHSKRGVRSRGGTASVAEEPLGNRNIRTGFRDQRPRREVERKARTPENRQHSKGDPYVRDVDGEVSCETCGDAAQHPSIDSTVEAFRSRSIRRVHCSLHDSIPSVGSTWVAIWAASSDSSSTLRSSSTPENGSQGSVARVRSCPSSRPS